MSNAEWTYLLIAGCAWVWLSLVRQEMAELVGNEERANELLEEWKEDRDAAKKANRQFWITWGVIGAGALAWGWFGAGW